MSSPSGAWSRMRELFDGAIALPVEERHEYLAASCGDDHALRDQVQKLLDSHERARSFLEQGLEPPSGARRTTVDLAGLRIGPYQVLARIGSGGMGDVYRARDTRLDRTVAIKVLSARVDADPHFLERFEREARAIGALNHPHICTLYDVGDYTFPDSPRPVHYLVMEYVEGETLAMRLAKGPLPASQALRVAAQIALALDLAHRAGIVHRDLKPGNVMLTKQGAKLLDFGVAKTAYAEGEADALTATGLMVGTLQYMAPEQLEGGQVDPRTDIFALGLVLSEMLTGKTNFAGTGSAALDRVVRKCLARDPDERWQSAADLASQLQWIADSSQEAAPPTPIPRGTPRTALPRVLWGLAGLAAVATAIVLAFFDRPPAQTSSAKKFAVTLTDGAPGQGSGQTVAITPDGSAFVYRGGSARDWRLHVYTMLDGTSRPLPGTERGVGQFFSPDGKSLAFFQDKRLMKVALAGGPPIPICDSCAGPSARGGGSWGTDDYIVFSTDIRLQRVSANGGPVTVLTTLGSNERWHIHPHLLPGNDVALFTVLSGTGEQVNATIEAVSVTTGQRTTLITSGSNPKYSATGHLAFGRGPNLFAAPFDATRLQVTGTPFQVLSDVRVVPLFLEAGYDFSKDGTLTYLPPSVGQALRSLVWVNRQGAIRHLPVPQRPYFNPSLLPDERSVIVELEETPHNIWRADLTTGALTRLTHESANHRAIVSADGRWMIFSSDRTQERSLFRQPTDGSGTSQQLTVATGNQNASSWSQDGKWLAFTEIDARTSRDIWILALDGDGKPQPFLQTPYSEEAAVFSPDATLLAYVSNQSGRDEVMLTTFPGPGPHLQVSVDGGQEPVFSSDGRRVFYRTGDRVLSAEVTTVSPLRVSAPRVAFNLPPTKTRTGLPNFAVNRAGDEVLTVKYLEDDLGFETVQVVVNWFELLHRAAASAQ